MELKDTAVQMTSPHYKDRFRAEYWQTKIRYEKLYSMIVKYEAGKLDFTPTCPLDLLKRQLEAMSQYLYMLEVRARLEEVDLEKPDCATCEYMEQGYMGHKYCSYPGYNDVKRTCYSPRARESEANKPGDADELEATEGGGMITAYVPRKTK